MNTLKAVLRWTYHFIKYVLMMLIAIALIVGTIALFAYLFQVLGVKDEQTQVNFSMLGLFIMAFAGVGAWLKVSS